MRTVNLILVFIIGVVVGHTVTPLISHNQAMRDICPFVATDHRDPDEIFIKFLNSKYKITIEDRTEQGRVNRPTTLP